MDIDAILIDMRSKFSTLSFQLLKQYGSGKKWNYIQSEKAEIAELYHKQSLKQSTYNHYELLKHINVRLASLWWRFVWDLTATAGNTETRRQSRSGYINQLKDMISIFDRALVITMFPLDHPSEIELEHPHLPELDFIEIFFPINVLLIAKFRLLASKLGLNIWHALQLLKTIKITLLPVLQSIYLQQPLLNTRDTIMDAIRDTLKKAERDAHTHPNKKKLTSLLPTITQLSLDQELLNQLPVQYHQFITGKYLKRLADNLLEVLRSQGDNLHDMIPKFQQLSGYRNLEYCLSQLELADRFGDGHLYLAEIPFSTPTHRGRADLMVLKNLEFDDQTLPVFLALVERKTKSQLAINLHKFKSKKAINKYALGIHHELHSLDQQTFQNIVEHLAIQNYVNQQLKIYTTPLQDRLIKLLDHHPQYSSVYKYHKPLQLISVVDGAVDAKLHANSELHLLHSFFNSLATIPDNILCRPFTITSENTPGVILICKGYKGSCTILQIPAIPVTPHLQQFYHDLTRKKKFKISKLLDEHSQVHNMIYAVPSIHQSGLKAALHSSLYYLLDTVISSESSICIVDLVTAAISRDDNTTELWGIICKVPVISIDLLSQQTTIEDLSTTFSTFTTFIITGLHLIRSYRNLSVERVELLVQSLLPQSATIYWIDTPPSSISFVSSYWSSGYLLYHTNLWGKLNTSLAGKISNFVWNLPMPVHSPYNHQPQSNTTRIIVSHPADLSSYTTQLIEDRSLVKESLRYHQQSKYKYLNFHTPEHRVLLAAIKQLLPWLDLPVIAQPTIVDIITTPLNSTKKTPPVPRLLYNPDLKAHGNSDVLPVTGISDLYAFEARDPRKHRQQVVETLTDPPFSFELTPPHLFSISDQQLFLDKAIDTEFKQLQRVCQQLSKQEKLSPVFQEFLQQLLNILDYADSLPHLQTIQTMISSFCTLQQLPWSVVERLLYQIRSRLRNDHLPVIVDFYPGLWYGLLLIELVASHDIFPTMIQHLQQVMYRYSTWVFYKLGYTTDRDAYTYSLVAIIRGLSSSLQEIASDLQPVLIDQAGLLPACIYSYPSSYLAILPVSATLFKRNTNVNSNTIPDFLWIIFRRRTNLPEQLSSTVLFSNIMYLYQQGLTEPITTHNAAILTKDDTTYLYLLDDNNTKNTNNQGNFQVSIRIYLSKTPGMINHIQLTPASSAPIQPHNLDYELFEGYLQQLEEFKDDRSVISINIKVSIDDDFFVADCYPQDSDCSDSDDILDSMEFQTLLELLEVLRQGWKGYAVDDGYYCWSSASIIYNPRELSWIHTYVQLPSPQFARLRDSLDTLVEDLVDPENSFLEIFELAFIARHEVPSCIHLSRRLVTKPEELGKALAIQLRLGLVHDWCWSITYHPILIKILGIKSSSTDRVLLSAAQLYQLYLTPSFWDEDTGFYKIEITFCDDALAVLREHELLYQIYKQLVSPFHPMMQFGSFLCAQYLWIYSITFRGANCVDVNYHNYKTGRADTRDYPTSDSWRMVNTISDHISYYNKRCLGLDFDVLLNPDVIEEFELDKNNFIEKHEQQCDCTKENTSLPEFCDLVADPLDSLDTIDATGEYYRLLLYLDSSTHIVELLPSVADNELIAYLIHMLCRVVLDTSLVIAIDEYDIDTTSDDVVDAVDSILLDLDPSDQLQHSISIRKLLEQHIDQLEKITGVCGEARFFARQIITTLYGALPDEPEGCIQHKYSCSDGSIIKTPHYLLSGLTGGSLRLCSQTLDQLYWLDLLDVVDADEVLPSIPTYDDDWSREQKLQYYKSLYLTRYAHLDDQEEFQLLYEIGSRQIRYDPILARSYLLAADYIYEHYFDEKDQAEFVYTSPETAPYPQLEASKTNILYNIGRSYEVEADVKLDYYERKLIYENAIDYYLLVDKLLTKISKKYKFDLSNDFFQLTSHLSSVYYHLKQYKQCLKCIRKNNKLKKGNYFENLLFKFRISIVTGNLNQIKINQGSIEEFLAIHNKPEVRDRYLALQADYLLLLDKETDAMKLLLRLNKSSNLFIRAFSLKRRIQILLINGRPYDKTLSLLKTIKENAKDRLLYSVENYLTEIRMLNEFLQSETEISLSRYTELFEQKKLDTKVMIYFQVLQGYKESQDRSIINTYQSFPKISSHYSVDKLIDDSQFLKKIAVLSNY